MCRIPTLLGVYQFYIVLRLCLYNFQWKIGFFFRKIHKLTGTYWRLNSNKFELILDRILRNCDLFNFIAKSKILTIWRQLVLRIEATFRMSISLYSGQLAHFSKKKTRLLLIIILMQLSVDSRSHFRSKPKYAHLLYYKSKKFFFFKKKNFLKKLDPRLHNTCTSTK